jgi:hypothetical protein
MLKAIPGIGVLVAVGLALGAPSLALCGERGISVSIRDPGGRPVGLYGGSYALLVGVSDYTAGWPDLESVPGEMARLEQALKAQGFQVVKHLNPDAEALERAFESFIDRYGYARDNRLLFFFSGHGHTRLEGRKGYLVPADAPNPERDERGFLAKALDMGQVMAWARRIEARHALFLFDSCFSGTVFKVKSLPGHPPHISRLTAEPVRQFISAGSAGEAVPAASVFTPAFIDAVMHGLGDLDRDGYVTGTELGVFLQGRVPLYADQTPQFGKIRDYDLSRGDFVFVVGAPPPAVEEPRAAVPDREADFELTFWRSIADSRQAADFRAYLEAYPRGRFVPLARARLAALEERPGPDPGQRLAHCLAACDARLATCRAAARSTADPGCVRREKRRCERDFDRCASRQSFVGGIVSAESQCLGEREACEGRAEEACRAPVGEGGCEARDRACRTACR